MPDNTTLNLDLDAPVAPSLTLDPMGTETAAAAPVVAAAEAPAAAAVEVNLTPEEQKMVDDFAEKIDITNSQQVLPIRRGQPEEDRRFLRGGPLQGGHQGSGRSGRHDHQPRGRAEGL